MEDAINFLVYDQHAFLKKHRNESITAIKLLLIHMMHTGIEYDVKLSSKCGSQIVKLLAESHQLS